MQLRNIFGIVIIFTMIISANGAGKRENLFPNPGFENKITRNFSLYPANTSATVKTDKKIFKDGKASARIDIVKSQDRMVLYTYVRLQPDKNYILSFWYKVRNWQKSSNYSTRINISFNKKNGKNGSAGKNVILFSPDSNAVGGWKKFTAEFKTPPNTYMCQLAILSARGVKGTLWIDSAKLELVADSLKINRASTPPQIDGKLNDACWKIAVPLNRFYRTNYHATPALVQTIAYMCYDDNNIYIAFRNSEPEISKLKADVVKRDGSVWNDDCNEIFLAAPNGKIRQFVVNSSNVQWDGELYMRVPGDPYRSNSKWNGKWQSAVKKGEKEWITEIALPFNNFKHNATGLWRLNLARERHGAADAYTHWNRADGKFNNVSKFSSLKFGKESAALSRFVEKVVENPFRIERKIAKFKELLSAEKGNYIVGSWAHGYCLSQYPKDIQAKYSPAQWRRERIEVMKETGLAGMFGPAFPWVDSNMGGMDKIKELDQKYGMKFVLSAKNSSLVKKAVKDGAVFVNHASGKRSLVDTVDPEMAKVMHDFLKNYLKKRVDVIPYLAVINGEDEPTNPTYNTFSLTANPENKKALEAVDARIKADFGFGKFGLYDNNAPINKNTPFNHIAFWSWWSEQYYKVRKEDLKTVKKLAPQVPYLVNFNSCGSFNYQDFTRISFAMDFVSCDPYPTSTMVLYGRNRALYHTGFSTKFLHDSAAAGVKTCVMPQGFIYHGRGPAPENIREWASQAMKNGASMLYWYAPGPLRVTIPDAYKEMLRVSNLVRSMKKLELPKKTVTALFFSQNTRRGIRDRAQYSLYTLYVLLGEKLKTWFKFVNETTLKLNVDSLEAYRLVYVPELKYTDSATAGKLLSFVKNGGTLVLFDPESFKWNINGKRMTGFRNKLVGAPVGKRRAAGNLIVSRSYLDLKKGDKLPLTKVRGRAEAGDVLAFEVEPPEDAKVFATYPDGMPAAYERVVGKGKVIYFAAQAFGNAELAVHKSLWEVFFSALAQEVGEVENLGIWDFLLPEKGGEVDVKYIIKPIN